MLIKLIVGITSQHNCLLNRQVIHLKNCIVQLKRIHNFYLSIYLLYNYTSTCWEKINQEKENLRGNIWVSALDVVG